MFAGFPLCPHCINSITGTLLSSTVTAEMTSPAVQICRAVCTFPLLLKWEAVPCGDIQAKTLAKGHAVDTEK